MTEAEHFAAIDAEPANTILVFDDIGLADRYVAHRAANGDVGMVCRVEDTRTGSGLLTQWRDPVPAADLARRQGEALWLLEEVLAGRVPRPVRGAINNIGAHVEARRLASKWHPGVTEERLSEMVTRRMTSLDNPGVCLACGIEAEGVEPDAWDYECEACGEHRVCGADEALMMWAAGDGPCKSTIK